MPIELYKTGETHSNGSDVYRKLGDKPRSNHLGLSGTYYIGDSTEMFICGKGYKDDYGVWDGEPLWPIHNFTIV